MLPTSQPRGRAGPVGLWLPFHRVSCVQVHPGISCSSCLWGQFLPAGLLGTAVFQITFLWPSPPELPDLWMLTSWLHVRLLQTRDLHTQRFLLCSSPRDWRVSMEDHHEQQETPSRRGPRARSAAHPALLLVHAVSALCCDSTRNPWQVFPLLQRFPSLTFTVWCFPTCVEFVSSVFFLTEAHGAFEEPRAPSLVSSFSPGLCHRLRAVLVARALGQSWRRGKVSPVR